MSFKVHLTLLSALALLVAACGQPTHAASRTPHDTLRDGTPEGDHTGSDPTNPSSQVGSNAAEDTSSGPEVIPAPGYSRQRRDPATPPSGGASGPNQAAPGGLDGPGQ